MKLDPSNQAHYDIMSALRGPDTDTADDAKWVFTARLRHFVGVTADGYSLVRDSKINPKQAEDAISQIRDLHHFRNHLSSAFKAFSYMRTKHREESQVLYSAIMSLSISPILEFEGRPK